MRRLIVGTLILGGALLAPWHAGAQSSTTSTSTSTTIATSTTATALPICVPGQNPPPVVGQNCVLPFIECIAVTNPPPQCPPEFRQPATSDPGVALPLTKAP